MAKRSVPLTALFALLLAAVPAPAQSAQERAARLDLLVERLEAERVERHVPGMALAVVWNGEQVLARGFGLADLAAREPVTRRTAFSIGSATKAFTATLVGMEVDAGRLEWDDPVSRHLPDFRLHDAGANERVTVRDLLCHRTGLTRMGLLWASAQLSPSEVLASVADAELYAPFRTVFLYNNVMYLAAGEASAAAAGEDWHALLRRRLLEPLGMPATHSSSARAAEQPSTAQGYMWDEPRADWRPLAIRSIASCAPAGAIFSNVDDMSRWIRFQLGGGELEGRRLISEEALNETWSRQTPMGPGQAYGLGWMVDSWEGRKVVHHGGNIDGYAAQVGLLPEEGLGFVLLMNVTASPLQDECLDLVWDTLVEGGGGEDVARTLTDEDLEPYVGTYRFEMLDEFVFVRADAGRLVLEIPGQATSVLSWPDEQGCWIMELDSTAWVAFAGQEAGIAEYMSFHQAGLRFELPREELEQPIGLDALLELRHAALGVGARPAPQSLLLEGDVRFVHQGVSGRAQLLSRGGERFVSRMDLGRSGRMESGVRGDVVWSDSVMEPYRELAGAESDAAWQTDPLLVFDDWRDRYEQVQVLGQREVRGRPAYAVRVGSPSRTVAIRYVDAETGLLVREFTLAPMLGLGSITLTTEFLDYGEVDGLQVPRRVTVEHAEMGRIEFEFDRIEVDPALPDSDFEPTSR